MRLPAVWDLVEEFKECCRSKNWNTAENDDVIEADHQYHKFFWVHHLQPTTFTKIITNSQCAIREGVSSKMVRLSYQAWILVESTSSIQRLQTIQEVSRHSRTVALYDLSPAYTQKGRCYQLNATDSPVFQEFEQFLKTEYGVELEPMTIL